MKRKAFLLVLLLWECSLAMAQDIQPLWPSLKKMPDAQPHQIAAMTDVSLANGFLPQKHRMPYLQWYAAPEHPNGACMILISGGAYQNCCDIRPVAQWEEALTALGFQCVNLVYRTPRPQGLPVYQSAWEDGQRAVRLVRAEAGKRHFDPERIGTVSMSAGSHLALLLGTSSLTRAYAPVDALDSLSCHINWALLHAPAYVTTDGETGTPAIRDGYGPGVSLSPVFRFDARTCPMVLMHGGADPYSPNGSTLVYRQLRRMGIPAEVHIYPDRGHGVMGFDRAALDSLSCHINWALLHAPAYVTTDGETGTPAIRDGYGPGVSLSPVFRFDARTCPMVLMHGGADPYSPNGSTLVYRQLRRMGIPAEVHIYPDRGHGVMGFDRAVEFMRQMGFLGPLEAEVPIMDRFSSDHDRADCKKEPVWPDGKMPDVQEDQGLPYIEWHFPKNRTTRAIQIIYSGGSYEGNDPDGFEVAPARRYLNAKGMTVVTLRYRTPRPKGLPKHISAWEDLQRAIRLVRSEAAAYGLDPDRIGIMGSSAGGHLTLMGTTSARHQAYLPIDELDKLPCKVQWGIAIYPAYSLSDGLEVTNREGGNGDSATLAPEYSFDLDTAPLLMVHGDSDPWAAMNSVKIWEKHRAMGIQSELHTLALRRHCFQRTASPGTGSYTYLDRIWEFLTAKGFNRP